MADQEMIDTLRMIINNMATKEDLAGMATKEDVEQSRRHTEILIETKIISRLDALTDGYKLNHEKQYELEREVDLMKDQISEMQTRLQALENRTA